MEACACREFVGRLGGGLSSGLLVRVWAIRAFLGARYHGLARGGESAGRAKLGGVAVFVDEPVGARNPVAAGQAWVDPTGRFSTLPQIWGAGRPRRMLVPHLTAQYGRISQPGDLAISLCAGGCGEDDAQPALVVVAANYGAFDVGEHSAGKFDNNHFQWRLRGDRERARRGHLCNEMGRRSASQERPVRYVRRQQKLVREGSRGLRLEQP